VDDTAPAPTIEGFDAYLAQQRELAPSSRDKYARTVRRMLRERVDDMTALDWLASIVTDDTSKGTVFSVTAACRWWSRYADEPWDEDNRPRTMNTLRGYREALSDDELRRYYAMIADSPTPDPYRTILLILPRMGLRITEACTLKQTDVIARGRTWGVLVRGKGHGGVPTQRYVPFTRSVHGDVRAYLDRHKPPRPWLFPSSSDTKRPAQPDTLRTYLHGLQGANPEHRVTPHVLRHTFATRALAAGTDMKTVQSILGHSSISSTALYLHPTTDMQRAGMEAAEQAEPAPAPAGRPRLPTRHP
jgi:integrase